jgi:hypothetical protein
MSSQKQIIIPVAAGLGGTFLLAALYIGIVSWAESPSHALELFWGDRWIVTPILLGFGVQSALYAILKKRLFIPGSFDQTRIPALAPGASMGAGGTTSTLAMIACCAHHVTDVLPILGLTAAATFLARYRIAFMWVGFGTTLIGIAILLIILFRERKRVERIILLPVVEETI